VDPAIDGNTGQQTLASKSLDSRLLQRAADKFTQFDVLPVSSSTVGRAQYLLAGTLTPLDPVNPTKGAFRDQSFADGHQDRVHRRSVRGTGSR
jgi:hypothetical protein